MHQRPSRSLLSLSILSALLLPALASAQDATTPDAAAQEQAAAPAGNATDLDAVKVTALRQSLETAQNIKRDSDMVVDSIVAEDIGKLPDNSVADALQRVTGVQIAQGSQGETTGVVIRGLPDVISTLNGREIFSSSGRGYAFQNLPATAVKTLSVYKTSEAQLPLGGIAGVVDIQLRRPFDFDGREVAATYNAVQSKYGGSLDPNASLLLSDRWSTGAGEFGALVNFGYIEKEYAYDAVWGDFPRILNDASGTPIRTEAGDLISVPGFGTAYNHGDRKRGSFNYALQWKPSESTEVYLEGLYDWVRDDYSQNYYFSFPAGGVSPSQLNVGNNCYANQLPGDFFGQQICDANGGTWTGDTYAATSTQAHEQKGQDIQNALGFKWQGDQLRLSTELSRTSGYYYNPNFIIDTFLAGPITTVWGGNGGGHVNWHLDGNPALDPNNFYLNGLFQTWSRSEGEENAWRGDGAFQFMDGPIDTIQFGMRYADRTSMQRGSYEISTPPPGGAGTGNITANPNPDNQVTARFPDTQFFCTMRDNSAMSQRWLTPCFDNLIANRDAYRNFYGLPSGEPGENPGRFFEIQEKKLAGYLQAKYDVELFGIPVSGLVGARIEKVERGLDAYSFDASTAVYSPLAIDTEDTNVLPNASMNLKFNDQWQLRVMAAKTLAYPGFGSLNPSISLNPGTINRAGQAASGNANLTPIESKSYDASLEWYFSPVGYASVGLFYRDIDGYIQNYTTDVTIGGEAYQLTQPQSAGTGYLQGVEAAWQQTFDFLPGAWSGLGAQFNYTYIDGETESPAFIGGPTVKRPLQNVSKTNYNAVLFYENFGVSARLAYGYRSRYIAGFTQNTVSGNEDQVEPANQLDFSVSYDVTPKTTIVLAATNLLGENFQSYWGGGNTRPRDIRYQDQTVSFGVRVKL